MCVSYVHGSAICLQILLRIARMSIAYARRNRTSISQASCRRQLPTSLYPLVLVPPLLDLVNRPGSLETDLCKLETLLSISLLVTSRCIELPATALTYCPADVHFETRVERDIHWNQFSLIDDQHDFIAHSSFTTYTNI